jgi:mannose-6-phosphate isomerase-like protein (cupin superfamily)
MARPGDRIENSQTGEVVTFVTTAAETGGELLVLELEWTRPGERAPEHVHPVMEERYEVVEGTGGFRVGDRETTAGPGEVVTVPPGTPHFAWNPTEEPVRLRVEFRPALRWEEFVERLFALVNQPGEARRHHLAALMREFRQEIVPPPPRSRG